MSEIRRLTADEFAQCGVALRDRKRLAAAIVCFERAVQLDPENAVFLYFLGNAYWRAERYGLALDALYRARKIDKTFHGVPHNLALAYTDSGLFDEAQRWYAEALALAPKSTDVALDRALTLLMAGDWRAGFAAYDARMEQWPDLYPKLSIPLWQGEPLVDKTIYVYAEQGIGDIIQFSRYLWWLVNHCVGGTIVFDAPAELMPLFRSWPGIVLRERDRSPNAAHPAADYYAPLLSLPRFHGTTVENVPADPGFFRDAAHALDIDFPKPPDGIRRVGICWAGNPTHGHDRSRSVALDHFLPLAKNPHIQLYSFQVGQRAGDITLIGADPLIYDLGAQLTDWQVTAAALLQMDLIVSVDTSVAHLAGAMDVPTWILIPDPADWRWLTRRSDTPWYPFMRLLRRERGWTWEGLMAKVAADLEAHTNPWLVKGVVTGRA